MQSCREHDCTVLIVEDDAAIRDIFQMALEVEGLNVVTAENGVEGLEALSNIANPCLILLDLMMPKMNGWEFMERLRDNPRNPAVPIVVISAFNSSKFPVPVELSLAKPIPLKTLRETVFKYCR